EGPRVGPGPGWPADYAGEPLVSFEAETAKGLHLKVGDTVTVNVLGRNVTARIANLRDVRWESLSLNFVMVFSPNTLSGAPHNMLATITLPRGHSLAPEAKLPHHIAHPRDSRQGADGGLHGHLWAGHGGGAGGRQRYAPGRCAGARRCARHRPAAAHPASRHFEGPRRHQPPHPAHTLDRICDIGVVNGVYLRPDRQFGGVDRAQPGDGG